MRSTSSDVPGAGLACTGQSRVLGFEREIPRLVHKAAGLGGRYKSRLGMVPVVMGEGDSFGSAGVVDVVSVVLLVLVLLVLLVLPIVLVALVPSPSINSPSTPDVAAPPPAACLIYPSIAHSRSIDAVGACVRASPLVVVRACVCRSVGGEGRR